jgi:hypothetical protein
MSTAYSENFQYLNIVSKVTVPEENNSGVNASDQTPFQGLFITPSEVLGRATDVTGFLVTLANEDGKVQITDPDGFLALDDLSDVTITAPVADQVLRYNGTTWVNDTAPAEGADTQIQYNDSGDLAGSASLTWTEGTTTLAVTGTTNSTTFTDGTATLTGGDLSALTTATITKQTANQGTDINTTVAINGGAGLITTQTATTAANGNDQFTVTNTAVTATSVVIPMIHSYSGDYTTNGLPTVNVANRGAGTFDIVISNPGTAQLNGTFVIGFVVL